MSDTHAAPSASCCHAKATGHEAHAHHPTAATPAHQGHAQHGAAGGWRGAARITLHCLTGCAIGEWTGLAIGVSLGLSTPQTIALAVTLAYLSGFGLTLFPLMRGGMGLKEAMKIVWIGEAVSIAAMELAMNFIDYHMGGMRRGMSLFHMQYWMAFSAAAVGGYLAAVPVNYWLLNRKIKTACH